VQNVPNSPRHPSERLYFWLPANVRRRRVPLPRTEINPSVWERLDMRVLLAVHDMAGVYRLLQRHGVSQRAIAARTGQSQSEIHEILKGRQVAAYQLFVRIADGLEVPPG